MVIYQVLNEQNQAVGEYSDFERAQHVAEDFTLWNDEHYFHVETIEIKDLH